MADPQEIPQIATELIDISREYLLQETIEPAKRLGTVAAKGVGGAMVLSIGAFRMAWAVYHGLQMVFPGGVCGVVCSRFVLALPVGVVGGISGWRMQNDDLPG